MAVNYRDVVVLVPGFFGFSRLGDFYYFADRVAAVLRGQLERALGRPVPVVGIDTRPAGGLASRQRDLLKRLQLVEQKIAGGPTNLHVIGHSTGGLDAQLLLAETPLSGSWGAIDPTHLRKRIKNIAAISTPFYGTCLSENRGVGFLAEPSFNPGAALDAFKLLFQAARLPFDNELVQQAIFASTRHGSGVAPFVWDLLTHRQLLDDLDPEHMAEVQRKHPVVGDTKLTCFVTSVADQLNPQREPDAFFKLMHRLTAQCSGRSCSAFPERLKQLKDAAAKVKSAIAPEIDEITTSTNDGVVNAFSQLLSSPNASFGGLVVADHADVLGHYERVDKLQNDEVINGGFFRSGSGFDDDEFFGLYLHVASALLANV